MERFMKRNDIPASSLFQSIVDKAKELFLSGCYFTVEDLNTSLGQNCAIAVILQLKRQGVNIQSMKLPDGRVIYGIYVDEASSDGNTRHIGMIMNTHSEDRESLMYHIVNRKGGSNGE